MVLEVAWIRMQHGAPMLSQKITYGAQDPEQFYQTCARMKTSLNMAVCISVTHKENVYFVMVLIQQ
jgi:hypothetical protein